MRRELGLVDSLDHLVQFGVTLLPVQVRLTADKLSLLQRCLDARPDAYRWVVTGCGPAGGAVCGMVMVRARLQVTQNPKTQLQQQSGRECVPVFVLCIECYFFFFC